MPSRVVIAFSSAESDRKAADSLAEGFTREGFAVEQATTSAGVMTLVEAMPPTLLIVSAKLDGEGEGGLSLVRLLRDKLGQGGEGPLSQPPVIALGDGEKRAAAMAAGASAFMPKPAFVKDIVTLARVLAMPREG